MTLGNMRELGALSRRNAEGGILDDPIFSDRLARLTYQEHCARLPQRGRFAWDLSESSRELAGVTLRVTPRHHGHSKKSYEPFPLTFIRLAPEWRVPVPAPGGSVPWREANPGDFSSATSEGPLLPAKLRCAARTTAPAMQQLSIRRGFCVRPWPATHPFAPAFRRVQRAGGQQPVSSSQFAPRRPLCCLARRQRAQQPCCGARRVRRASRPAPLLACHF
jgi:hypothetical protein